ncbi:nonstructural protein 1a [Qinghai Himalayan marmot astrovirus 2]|uniref:nonstructural protein 1a n=1 Tax=Qinghai Himalayan marmot astrovirus 2 TaxID=1961666 RepID=UPI0009806205|nr:nonstructural protein 1a [Qinghai Himalayan marmot astrovirus 2]AQM49971.1 nonstructural protein 1a [Qinghai Himalayan marmot astrovirus 2]
MPFERRLQLLKLFPGNVPITVVRPLRCHFFPSSDIRQRILFASGVARGEYRGYFLDTEDPSASWVLSPHDGYNQKVAFFGVQSLAVDQLKVENAHLKNELSQLKLECQLMRHDLERARRCAATQSPKQLSPFLIFLLLFVFFSSLLSCIGASELPHEHYQTSTTGLPSTKAHSSLIDRIAELMRLKDKATVDLAFTARAYADLKSRIEEVDEMIRESVNPDRVKSALGDFVDAIRLRRDHWLGRVTSIMLRTLPNLPYWWLITTPLAAVCACKNLQPVTALIFLGVSSLTRWNFAALAVSPALDAGSAWLFIVVQLVYLIDPTFSIFLSLAGLPAAAVLGCFLPTPRYVDLLRGTAAVGVVSIMCHLALTFGVSTSAVTLLVVCYRISKLIVGFGAEKVEFKTADGKVIHATTSSPNWLWRFAQRLRQAKVRSTSAPFVRICPEALCRVSTNSGTGTGFRLGNDIITAKHVVDGNTVVTVTYNGYTVQAHVRRELTKDIAYLRIPTELQNRMPSLKLAKNPNYDIVTVMARDDNGAVIVATTEGAIHGDSISYACATRDGMSGCPVLDINGHVLGVHQTNTGYTGGAVVITKDDLVETNPKDAEIAALREELSKLRACEQSTSPDDVVGIVRAAVQREIQVLRDELNKSSLEQKKKGKTKKGRGRVLRAGRRRARLTEEEYEELLSKGLTREQLIAAVEELLDQDVEAGFPEWSDPDYSDDDADDVWFGHDRYGDNDDPFGQKDKKSEKPVPAPRTKKTLEARDEKPPVTFGPKPDRSHYQCGPVQQEHLKKYDPDCFLLTKADMWCLEHELEKLRRLVGEAKAVTTEEWKKVKEEMTNKLNEAYFELDCAAWANGLQCFSQRVKPRRQPKNSRRGPVSGPQKPSN